MRKTFCMYASGRVSERARSLLAMDEPNCESAVGGQGVGWRGRARACSKWKLPSDDLAKNLSWPAWAAHLRPSLPRAHHAGHHEGGEDHPVRNILAVRRQGRGPEEHKGVHGRLKERLDRAQDAHARVWGKAVKGEG